jgi:hypothetical protein
LKLGHPLTQDRCLDVELRAQMTSQHWRHDAQSLEQTAGHAQKTNL